MNWSEILLLVCAALSIFLLFYKGSRHRQIRIFASIAILCVAVTLFPGLFSAQQTMVLEWAGFPGLTKVLLVLASFFCQWNPTFPLFPYPFSFTPLLCLFFIPMFLFRVFLKFFR